MKRSLFLLLPLLRAAVFQAHGADKFDLKPNDHIAIIGNTLADRFQHDGWLETLLYEHLPKHDLVVRNLAAAGDEVVTRSRSENFGSPDDWLTKTQTDVILAFFGFNESFGGYDGLEKFKQDLDKFIKDTKTRNYSGKGAPRLVLFSPIAQEKHPDPNLPDPTKNNTNLKNYTDAMAEIAKANGIPFVDLYTPSQQLYASAVQPLTIDGIHLSAEGDKALAPVIYRGLFDEAAPKLEGQAMEKLRAAIIDRNEVWHSRYRTVDGYNVFGGRSALAFEPGKRPFITNRDAPAPFVSNFKVMQEEMAERDVMTANRDKKVWAIARGGDLEVDDSNLPPVTSVQSNERGDKPDGSYTYLSAEEAIKHMTVPKGCKVNLFASEEQFPELKKAVQMAWDAKGRLWVAVWPNYPERTPTNKTGDSILILEDTKGTGKADKCTHFIDGLNCPTGFQFYKDGILLMQPPDLWYIRDTKGTGKADSVERVLMGMDSADTHHTSNAMALDPGGAVYLSDGVFHRSQVETASGPVRNIDAAIYRYEPRTSKFETYVSYPLANPHGRVFDYWGNDIITDATSNSSYFGPAFSGHIDYPEKHPTTKLIWERVGRPCANTALMTSTHFPEEFWNNFLDCNVISHRAIMRVKPSEEGSGITGHQLEHLVISDDPNFRPCFVNVGPDGAIYFLDWCNALIGHMQHHMRDPNRDHTHGRIYRITYEGRPLRPPLQITALPTEKLLDLLKSPEDDIRLRTKVELGARESSQVIAAVHQWASALDKSDPAYEHHMMEALWVHQWHNIVDPALLKRMLHSPEPHARAAAGHVLCYWRDRVPEALALYKELAADENPRVRLEAVRGASFFSGTDVPAAVDVLYTALERGTDYYLDYCATETLRQLQPSAQDLILPQNPKALSWVVEHLDNTKLVEAPGAEPVLVARLERTGIDLPVRDAAVAELAKLRHTDRVTEIIAALQTLDQKGADSVPAIGDLAKILTLTPAADLARHHTDLAALAKNGNQSPVRQTAWAAVATADARPETTWKSADSESAQEALVDALASIADPTVRGRFQPHLSATLADAKTSDALREATLRALPLMGPQNAQANFLALSASLRAGQHRTAAARAIMQLPRDSWSKVDAAPIAEAILAWAQTVPADQRTTQSFVETLQGGMEMASLLPPEDGSRLRKQMRDLSVSVFVVKTVREGMRYDTPRLVVELGKPFEIIFENVDAMPHNLVIVKPGKREEVGLQANVLGPEGVDNEGRAFIPKNESIIAATKLLQTGQKQTLKVKAPAEPGEDQYLCTFPGHWPVMFGKLIVTKDPEAALQAAAEAAPPALPAPTAHVHH